MAFHNEDFQTFFIGTESGRLYRCLMNEKQTSSLSNESVAKEITFTNPIAFSYEPHVGPGIERPSLIMIPTLDSLWNRAISLPQKCIFIVWV
jgi:hypothetical protein